MNQYVFNTQMEGVYATKTITVRPVCSGIHYGKLILWLSECVSCRKQAKSEKQKEDKQTVNNLKKRKKVHADNN